MIPTDQDTEEVLVKGDRTEMVGNANLSDLRLFIEG